MKKRRAGKKKENRSRSTGSPTSANPSCVPFNSINAYPATITCFFFTHKNIPWNAFSHRPYINLDKSTSADHMSADFVFFFTWVLPKVNPCVFSAAAARTQVRRKAVEECQKVLSLAREGGGKGLETHQEFDSESLHTRTHSPTHTHADTGSSSKSFQWGKRETPTRR